MQEGATVWCNAIFSMLSRSLLRSVVLAAEKELKDFAARSEVLQLDVSNEASVKNAAKYVAEKFGAEGSVYGVVNNAGVWLSESVQETLEVNCYGAKRVIDNFVKLLKPKGTLNLCRGFASICSMYI